MPASHLTSNLIMAVGLALAVLLFACMAVQGARLRNDEEEIALQKEEEILQRWIEAQRAPEHNEILETKDKLEANENDHAFYNHYMEVEEAWSHHVSDQQNGVKQAGRTESKRDDNNPPHVFIFLVDDMGFNDISWNNEDVLSPNLQALAAEGTILDFNYAQAVCSPSRGSLMFGKYAVNTGMQHDVILYQSPECADLDDTMLPEKLRDGANYKTYMVGKWHLGFCNDACLPTNRGFDDFYGFYQAGIGDYYTKMIGYRGSKGYDFHDADGTVADNTTYFTDLLTQRAIQMIEDHDADEPMFLYVSQAAVHTPLQVQTEFFDMYEDYDGTYYQKVLKAMVTSVDDSIGQIVDAIKASDMYDNSVIIMSSDNGGQAYIGSNAPLRGAKSSIYEGGTRVPALFHSPRQTVTNNRAQGLFHISDWHTTILSLAGINTDGLDGVDQTEMLFNGGDSARNEIVYNVDSIYPQYLGAYGIRVGDYKLLKGYPGLYDGWEQEDGVGLTNDFDYITGGVKKRSVQKRWSALDYEAIDAYISHVADVYQLYNLADDPEEMNNLADDPSMQSTIADLQARLDELSDAAHHVDLDAQVETDDGLPSNFGGVWSPGWC